MNRIKKNAWLSFSCLAAVVFTIHICGYDAIASENAAGWRSLYDTILRWLNFGILVFIIVKFGKTPITNFLKGQKEELALEIKKIEEEKEIAVAKTEEIQQKLDESDLYFSQLKNRIIEQGEKKKQQIIDKAHKQSLMMIDESKRKIGNQILTAKDKFRSELVDASIDLALKRLPDEITSKDDQKLLDNYITGIN